MILGIDHLVIAVADLEAASEELSAGLGLEVVEGGRHLTLGTRNALCWLGDSYLELLAVTDPALAARSWIGAPALATLALGGGLATYALASDDLGGDIRRLRSAGSNVIGPLPGERLRPDGQAERWLLALLPELAPDRPPFLIEHLPGSPEWRPDARRHREEGGHRGGRVRLRRLEIPVADPEAVAEAYRRELALQPEPRGLPSPGMAAPSRPEPSSPPPPSPGTPAQPSQVRGFSAGRQSVVLTSPIGQGGVDPWPAHLRRPPATVVLSSDAGTDRELELLGCRFVVERAEIG